MIDEENYLKQREKPENENEVHHEFRLIHYSQKNKCPQNVKSAFDKGGFFYLIV